MFIYYSNIITDVYSPISKHAATACPRINTNRFITPVPTYSYVYTKQNHKPFKRPSVTAGGWSVSKLWLIDATLQEKKKSPLRHDRRCSTGTVTSSETRWKCTRVLAHTVVRFTRTTHDVLIFLLARTNVWERKSGGMLYSGVFVVRTAYRFRCTVMFGRSLSVRDRVAGGRCWRERSGARPSRVAPEVERTRRARRPPGRRVFDGRGRRDRAGEVASRARNGFRAVRARNNRRNNDKW